MKPTSALLSHVHAGTFGPSPPIVQYAKIYKSDDDLRKKPAGIYMKDTNGKAIIDKHASNYNKCSVNYPGVHWQYY